METNGSARVNMDRGRDGSRDRSRSGGRSRDRDRRDDRDDGRDRGNDRRDRSPDRRGGRSRSRSRGRGGSENGSDTMNLEAGAVAYLLGRNGATKQRLANFSGARLEIDPRGESGGKIEIIGTEDERRLAKMCIDITLQQRNNGQVIVDLDALESRGDITIFDVPLSAVGFVLGSKGATLRELETKYRTFMFFDNDNIRDNKKRLYILGTPENRRKALDECENAVNYKMSGNGSSSLPSWRERDGGPRYDRSYRRSRSRSRGRGGYDDRRDDDRDRGYDRRDDRDRGGGGGGGGGGYRDEPRRRSRSRDRGRGYDDRDRGGSDRDRGRDDRDRDRGYGGGRDDRRDRSPPRYGR